MPVRTQVYYDGRCPVCSREVALYKTRRGSHAFDWVDVESAYSVELGPGLSRDQALARMHVRTPEGELLSGAAAFGAIWRGLPGLRWLGRLMLLPAILPVAEISYRVFLAVRKLWRPLHGTGR